MNLRDKELMDSREGKSRYLLFDSGCSACTDIAHSIEQETEGWLTARSLRDIYVQELLTKARPNWRWEPTLLEIGGDRPLAFTGLPMKLRLLAGLGPRRATRVARIARRSGAFDLEIALAPSQEDPERYSIESVKRIDRSTALKGLGALGLGAALLPLLPQSVLAQGQSGERTASATKTVRRKIQVTNWSSRNLRTVSKNEPMFSGIQERLASKGFHPGEGRGGTWGTSSSRTIGTDWVFSYQPRNGRNAYASFSKVGNKRVAGYVIWDRNGNYIERYKLSVTGSGQVYVQSDEKPRTVRSAMPKNSGGGQFTAEFYDECNVCQKVIDFLTGVGCADAWTSLAAAAVCGAAAPECAFGVALVIGAVCYFGADLSGFPYAICANNGFC